MFCFSPAGVNCVTSSESTVSSMPHSVLVALIPLLCVVEMLPSVTDLNSVSESK